MKAVLEFSLPEDKLEFEQARKGLDAILCLFDYTEYLSALLKYNNKGMDEATIERLQEQLKEIIDSYDLNFDNLIE